MVFKCSNWVNWVQLDKMDNQLEKSIANSEQSRKIVENSQIVKLARTVKLHKLPNLSQLVKFVQMASMASSNSFHGSTRQNAKLFNWLNSQIRDEYKDQCNGQTTFNC